MDLHLTPQQVQLVTDVLKEQQHELQREIPRTDVRDYKLKLRQREEMITDLLDEIAAAEVLAI